MIDIKTEIDSQAVNEAIGRLAETGQNPAPLLDVIGRQIKTNIQLGFTTSTSPYGEPWAPLKVRQGQILVDRGHLLGSIDYRVEGASVDVGVLSGPASDYARIQQEGGTITAKNAKALRFFVGGRAVFVKKVTIPPRPYLPLDGLPADWQGDVAAVIDDFFSRLPR